MEKMSSHGSPSSNDEVLINIGNEIQNFWKVQIPPQPTTQNYGSESD